MTLPSVDLSSAVATVSGRISATTHHSATGVAGCSPRWWQVLHATLRAADLVGDEDRALLPPGLRQAMDAGPDALTEAWLDTVEILDNVWTALAHCRWARDLLAHLVAAAACGGHEDLAEMLGRDLLRACVVVADHPVEVMELLDEADTLLDDVGVTVGVFRDLLDVAAGENPTLLVDGICHRGERVIGSRGSALDGVRSGEVLVVDAGGLYDRQLLRVTARHGAGIGAVEIVTGLMCTLVPRRGGWMLVLEP